MQKAYIAERNEMIAEMYNSGKSIQQIGNDVGLTESGVGHILRKMGVPMRPAHTHPDAEKILSLAREGLTQKAISEQLQLSVWIVSYYLHKANIYARNKLDDSIVETMRKLRADGMSNREIADTLKISYNSVYNYIGVQPKEITKINCEYAHKQRSVALARKEEIKKAMKQREEEERLRREEEKRLFEERLADARRVLEFHPENLTTREEVNVVLRHVYEEIGALLSI